MTDDVVGRVAGGVRAAHGTRAEDGGDAAGGAGRRLRALITNDDGIDATGIRWLARAALAAGLEPVVAAPLQEASGCGAGVTLVESGGKVVVEDRQLEGLAGVPAYGVAALPAFITLIALRGAFGPPPDLVLSGINHGPNLGHSILHSGTVGAALTAVSGGVPALAVSLWMSRDPKWETAAHVVPAGVSMLLGTGAPVALNLNVPDLPVEQLRGLRRSRLAPFGTVEVAVSEVTEGSVRIAVSYGNELCDPDTDARLLADGYVTVTAVRSVGEADDVALPELTELPAAGGAPGFAAHR